MNNLITRRLKTVLVLLLVVSSVSFAQFKDTNFLRSAPADGVKFVQAYFAPWANAFGAGLSGSWYNTAKPHKLGGFDITGGLNVGIVPTSAETFDISKIGLSSSITGTGVTPTVAGPKSPVQTLTYQVGGQTLAQFKTPEGSSLRFIPVPTLQLGIGLPLGTEVKLRYVPKINIDKGDISLWGVGLMHSIMQYLPGNKLLPLDVSIFGGYTKLSGNVPLNLQPDLTVIQNYTAPYSSTFKGQNMTLSITALNVSAIASVNLKVITFYGGLGYAKTETLLKLQGSYPTPVLAAANILSPIPHAEYNNTGVKNGVDFPKMDIGNFSGLRANIGFRLKLAVLTIYADYTRAQYNVVSAGMGLSFR